jgi:sugar/nucleoside kinase (ribokinase family)
MRAPDNYQLVGLATAVSAVVVRPGEKIVIDGAVSGDVFVGRGGMVCNTLAVASALGARVGGVIASGSDTAGAAARETVAREGIMASFITTPRTPVTVTLVEDATRSSIMGTDGAREADLDPEAIEAAWDALDARPLWVLLTLPALDSPAGTRFISLAHRTGAKVALTLSSAGHVRARASRLRP